MANGGESHSGRGTGADAVYKLVMVLLDDDKVGE